MTGTMLNGIFRVSRGGILTTRIWGGKILSHSFNFVNYFQSVELDPNYVLSDELRSVLCQKQWRRM